MAGLTAIVLVATPSAFAGETAVIDGPVTVTAPVVAEPAPTPTPEPTPEPAPTPAPDPVAVDPPPPPPAEPDPAPPAPAPEPRTSEVPPVVAEPATANPEPVAVSTGSSATVDARSETPARSEVAINADEQAEAAPTGGTGFLTSDRTTPLVTLTQLTTTPLPVKPAFVRSDDPQSPGTGALVLYSASPLFDITSTVPSAGPSSTRTRRTAAAPPPPSHSPQATVPLQLGGLLPTTGGSDGTSRLAGLLAFVMGMLPFAPNDRFSTGPLPQVAILALGAMVAVLGFFSFPLRDRRRRGPRGFATLALRPG